MAFVPGVRDLPIVPRLMVLGAALLGAAGGCVGLVLGLFAYPPTAWFAVLEVGVPSALLGAVLGLVSGTVASAVHRSRP